MSLPQIAGLEPQELIGRGSCGAVYRAVDASTGTACAVKVFGSMNINRKLLAIAMRGLQNMPGHPGILPVTSFSFDSSPYYSVMPLSGFQSGDGQGRRTWENPTLESSCGKVNADEAWRYLYEICDAMAWLHKHNLVHCNLKPRNVQMTDDPASATKITDIVQGWVGGIHHFEATDHFMYMPPEQAEYPDQLTSFGTSWDAYAFGVLAYRLLTGQFPRGDAAYHAQLEAQQQARGVVPGIDNQALLATIKSQTLVDWPTKPTTKWDERRRQILDRCLSLDPKLRWPDLREVMREFEKLEADYLLEDAREKIVIEKKRQTRKVWLLRTAAVILTTAFISSLVIGLSSWWGQRSRAQKAETTIAENAAQFLNEVTTHKSTITDISQKLEAAEEAKRTADSNLQLSQEAADQFLNQLLQLPTGLGLEAEMSEKQITDALAFYEREREQFQGNESMLSEQSRNYFNTAQLLMRKQRRAEAKEYFEKARSTVLKLMQEQPEHVDMPRRQALLGRTCRWLGTLVAEDSHRVEAFGLFKQAANALASALQAEPNSRLTRVETATAWYELGKRARRDSMTNVAVESLAKVPEIMDAKNFDGVLLSPQEQFLVSRSRIEQALAQRDQGKLDEAMQSLFESMEVMVKLVERSAPNNQEQALALAEAYIEFGEIVAGKLGNTDAKDSQTEAHTILMELIRLHPQWADARFLLARNYGCLAVLERDMGNASEAVRKQNQAVQTLSALCTDNPTNTRFLTELGRQQGQQAQLNCDLGRASEAVKIAQTAVAQVANVLDQPAGNLDELDRKTCGVLMAQLYGILGHSSEIAKNPALAKIAFTKASEQWETLKAQHGSDDLITQGLSWTQDRLKKIK